MSEVWWMGFGSGFGVGVLYCVALSAWSDRNPRRPPGRPTPDTRTRTRTRTDRGELT